MSLSERDQDIHPVVRQLLQAARSQGQEGSGQSWHQPHKLGQPEPQDTKLGKPIPNSKARCAFRSIQDSAEQVMISDPTPTYSSIHHARQQQIKAGVAAVDQADRCYSNILGKENLYTTGRTQATGDVIHQSNTQLPTNPVVQKLARPSMVKSNDQRGLYTDTPPSTYAQIKHTACMTGPSKMYRQRPHEQRSQLEELMTQVPSTHLPHDLFPGRLSTKATISSTMTDELLLYRTQPQRAAAAATAETSFIKLPSSAQLAALPKQKLLQMRRQLHSCLSELEKQLSNLLQQEEDEHEAQEQIMHSSAASSTYTMPADSSIQYVSSTADSSNASGLAFPASASSSAASSDLLHQSISSTTSSRAVELEATIASAKHSQEPQTWDHRDAFGTYSFVKRNLQMRQQRMAELNKMIAEQRKHEEDARIRQEKFKQKQRRKHDQWEEQLAANESMNGRIGEAYKTAVQRQKHVKGRPL